MVLPEPVQRSWKRRLLADALDRIGGFRHLEPDEVVPSPRELAYRNKVEFTIGRTRDGRPAVGLRGPVSNPGLVDIESCLLQDETANRVLRTAREFFLRGPGRRDPALYGAGEPVRLVIRRSEATGQLLVALRTGAEPFRSFEQFADTVRLLHPEVRAVARIVASAGRRGRARIVPLAGEPVLEESLGGSVFRLPAASFFQTNTPAAEGLVAAVAERAGPLRGRDALDLYGGLGTFGLALARRGATVTVVEADAAAVAAGREAASRVLPGRVRFARAGVGPFLRGAARSGLRPDVIVADPPRAGLGADTARAISSLAASRIVLVSCDPVTLARDLRHLVGSGYALERVTPFDLFPQTAHLETVASLGRA